MRHKKRYLLLLTATIDPKGMAFTVRQSPTRRLNDYQSALRKWCSHRDHFRRIVLCENSGYPIPNDLRNGCGNASNDFLTILQFEGNNYPRSLGKGYGEAKSIEYALGNFPEIDDYDYIVKCTGRLYVPNVLRVLKALDKGPDIACTLRKDLSFADSRLFAVRPQVIETLIQGFAEEVNDSAGIYFEHVLAKRVLQLVSKGAHFSPWAEPPYYVGISGSTGKRLDSLQARARHLVKKMLYKLSRFYTDI